MADEKRTRARRWSLLLPRPPRRKIPAGRPRPLRRSRRPKKNASPGMEEKPDPTETVIDLAAARKAVKEKKTYDKDTVKPILKCSICNGEQVAGFKDIRTGKFEEVMLIRDKNDLDDFMGQYGIREISKEY